MRGRIRDWLSDKKYWRTKRREMRVDKKELSKVSAQGLLDGAKARIFRSLDEEGISEAEKTFNREMLRIESYRSDLTTRNSDIRRIKKQLDRLMKEIRKRNPPRPPVKLVKKSEGK